ncbi:hypothetical protein CPB84DRAFT_1749169 [Gymnopilus junonius]|uniref:MSP domain-containing protein n=1 Tax=Gymnopilus junonius TaxID=109634 RepID=A0A9P5NK43_GYMJU|nr:hypothetical protein CPB84DRAFT_1749169 [Gymnopilus junonius]
MDSRRLPLRARTSTGRHRMARKRDQKVVIFGEGLGVLNAVAAGVSHDGGSIHSRDHVASTFLRPLNRLPTPPSRHKMSVSLNPPNALGFRRPLTSLVKRSLTITNNNTQPIAFKVKTTAPKLYCVRPNSGRVEPGESLDVSVMLQALKEEPPLNIKCKDKFLIQSTFITPEKETLALADIWSSPDMNEEGKVFQQKLRVTYLPAEGQIDEEDENHENVAGNKSVFDGNESFNGTIRPAGVNGHHVDSHYVAAPAPEHHEDRAHTPVQDLEREVSYQSEAPSAHHIPIIIEPSTQPPPPSEPAAAPAQTEPAPEYEYEHEPASEPAAEPPAVPIPIPTPVRVPSPAPVPPPASAPAPAPAPEPIYITRENPINEELYAKYRSALEEIDRLKAQVAQLSSPAAQELRRRTRKYSDADSAAGSDVQTIVEESPLQQEGVPLQIVVIIALGIFVTTYLFF